MRSDSKSTMATMTGGGFDDAVEAFRRAQAAFVQGDPKPVTELFSRRDDVTLANPLLPPQVGPVAVGKAAAAAAAQIRDGAMRGYDEVSRYSTADLGYVVQIERAQARFGGSEDMALVALRVTLIFRREGDAWKIVHRHADPITTPQPISTLLETN
ncbi:nuclear transport factor 2 family protein [Kribbella sp. NBC_01245]|uniref:YybH family protein n=1 Tax=Kribbella sp. NBC_01245 TaxID=2903578 RepID=UPI002E2CA8B7|nr:nuclear transport factor 2 family protein [Kribbella sp. NBC_01245]